MSGKKSKTKGRFKALRGFRVKASLAGGHFNYTEQNNRNSQLLSRDVLFYTEIKNMFELFLA